jgi:hypothetical protein
MLGTLLFVSMASAQPVWTEIGDGLRHAVLRRSGPVRAHVVEVDLCEPSVAVRATQPSERGQRTSAWAADVSAQVAINADFFSTGFRTSGLAVGQGNLFTDSRDSSDESAVAYSPAGILQIRPAGETLAAPLHWMHDVVSGRPVCLRDGRVVSSTASHYGTRNPRTGIGLSRDGRTLYLVVVDGRSSSSIGVTTGGLGDILLDVGAYDGLNFDGGGSSAMYIRGMGVVNAPSDGTERTVANHLGIMRRTIEAGEPSWCCSRDPVEGAPGRFVDVAADDPALDAIEDLVTAGAAIGCQADPPAFCGACRATRGFVQATIVRAAGEGVAAPTRPTYPDIDASNPYFGEIERAVELGWASGCSSTRYCSERLARRRIVARMLGLATGLREPALALTDVPADDTDAGAIAAMIERGFMEPCAADRFCPEQTATRAEVARAVAAAFAVEPPPPDAGNTSDAGSSDSDAGTTIAADAGATPAPPDAGCECNTTSSGSLAWLFVAFILLRRRS